MKVYYEFSQDLKDLELMFFAEKGEQVYRSLAPIPKNTKIQDVKGLVDWFNRCLEEVEKL